MNTTLTVLRWVVAAPFLVFGAFVILVNWEVVAQFILARCFGRAHKEEFTMPVQGPFWFCFGLMVAAGSELSSYAWLSFVVDPATYILLARFPFLFREWLLRKGKRIN
jgi:hypothetical protein